MTPTDYIDNIQVKNPIVLFSGEEKFFLDNVFQALKKSLPEETREESFIEVTNVSDAVSNLREVSLFGDARIVILNDPTFMTSKGSIDKETERMLTEYIEQPEVDNIFVINAVGLTIDKRKKINKLIQSKMVNVDFAILEASQLKQLVKKHLKKVDVEMDDVIINKFLERINFQPALLRANLDKLALYGSSNSVTEQIVDELVDVNVADDVLTLAAAINENNREEAVKIYRRILDNGETPIAINAFLLSQYRLMLQIASSGFSEQQVASMLKKHPYRVKKTAELAAKMTGYELISKFKQLVNIDHALKSTSIDPKMMIEMFIAN